MAAPDTFGVSDFLEIQRLMHSFNKLFDEGDADGFAALFTVDGILDSPSGDCPTAEERREKVRDSVGRPPHRHFTTNVLIDPHPTEPGRATSYAHFIYLEQLDGTFQVASIGTYTDDLATENGAWRFRRRTATSDKLL